MIDFRYHVVSIVAVILALALGLFLGSTTLQGKVLNDLQDRTTNAEHRNTALQQQLSLATSQLKAQNNFDTALLPSAVAGRLAGESVVVVSGPGASDSVRKQLMEALVDAGATVSADVRMQNALADPKQDALVQSLADHLEVPNAPGANGATGAERAVGQLAAVLGTRPGTKPVADATVQTVLSTYKAAKLISVSGSVTPHPGALAVVLSGPAPSPTADSAITQSLEQLMVTTTSDLDTVAAGAILAAPTPPAGSGSDVIAAASSTSGFTKAASTVAGIDTAAGQIAAVFALAGQLHGIAGQFGLGSQSAALPTQSPSP